MTEKSKIIANLIFILHIFWMLWAIVSLPLIFLFDWYLLISLFFLIITIGSWLIFDECLFNRWEHRLRGWDYDVENNRGEFMVKIFNLFSIKISGKKAAYINQGYVLLLLVITLLRFFFKLYFGGVI